MPTFSSILAISLLSPFLDSWLYKFFQLSIFIFTSLVLVQQLMNEPSLYTIRIKINSIKNRPITNLSDIQPPTVTSCTLQSPSTPRNPQLDHHTLTVPSMIHPFSQTSWKNMTACRNNEAKFSKRSPKLNYNTVNTSNLKKMPKPKQNLVFDQEGGKNGTKIRNQGQENSKTKVYSRWTVWSPSKLKNTIKCYSQNIIDKNHLEMASTKKINNPLSGQRQKKSQYPVHLTQSFIKQNSRISKQDEKFDYISIAQGLKLQVKKKRERSQADFTIINYLRNTNRSSQSTYRQNISAGESKRFMWYCTQRKDQQRKKEINKRDWTTKDTIRPWSGLLGPQAEII